MKTFCYTVDDNIRFLKEIAQNRPKSIFDHPYLAMYRRLHEKFDIKVQLNLFYSMDGFDLTQMPDTYRDEWTENADWLKLSFHSKLENLRPYEYSGYQEVFDDCKAVNEQILRFASEQNLAKTTTIHYCLTTSDGLQALRDHNIQGLLGLYGTQENPTTSYGIRDEDAILLRGGALLTRDKITHGAIDLILNCFSLLEISVRLQEMVNRDGIRLMIHEQYFYEDYKNYQPDFEQKLRLAFSFLKNQNYASKFFEEII